MVRMLACLNNKISLNKLKFGFFICIKFIMDSHSSLTVMSKSSEARVKVDNTEKLVAALLNYLKIVFTVVGRLTFYHSSFQLLNYEEWSFTVFKF